MAAVIPILLVTYLVVALGRFPGLRIDRAGAALIGPSLMVGAGVLSLDEAYRAIDLSNAHVASASRSIFGAISSLAFP
jgi:Na+/H+ antiporter NhaD/arsenite permease-like protein